MREFEKLITSPDTYKLRIIVHDGVAHADERLGCAMAYAYAKTLSPNIVLEILRTRDVPTEKEEGVAQMNIDVGLEFDNEFKFDHHQTAKNVYEKCAATLIANRFFPELWRHPEFAKYLERIRIQDTKGLNEAAEVYGNEEVGPFMFDEFEQNRRFEVDPTGETIRNVDFINRYVYQAREYHRAIVWAEDKFNILDTDAGNVLMWKPGYKAELADLDFGLKRLVNSTLIDRHEAVAVVSFNNYAKYEGNVFRFFRTNIGADKINFNLWKPSEDEEQGIKFCHNRGFLLLVNFFDETAESAVKIINKCTL